MPKTTAPTALRLDQQVESRVTTITPAVAEEWLGRNESNRNARPLRLAQLVRDMKAGKFVLTGESIKFDWHGNLIDGQHRLIAVRESGVAIEALVVTGLAPTVRSVIDTGAKRSAGDALKMAGSAANWHTAAAAIKCILAVRTGAVQRAGDRLPDVTHAEVLDFYNADRETIDYVAAFGVRHYKSMRCRPAVIAAAAYIAASADLARFTNFVNRVVNLQFHAQGDPARTLYRRLEVLRDERHAPSDELYYVLRAFEADLAGRSMSMLKASNAHGRSIIPTFRMQVAA